MSQLGQSRHFGRWPTTSGLPLETDIVRVDRHVSKVPVATLQTRLEMKRGPPIGAALNVSDGPTLRTLPRPRQIREQNLLGYAR